MNFGTLFFSFSGRINRAKYWLGVLIYVIVTLVFATLNSFLADSTPFQLLQIIVNIGVFISGLALGAKRLHDRNKSAWWLLLFFVMPTLLFSVAAVMFFYGLGSEEAGSVIGATVVFGLALMISIWTFVELGCLRGTTGPNRFGPDPLATAAV